LQGQGQGLDQDHGQELGGAFEPGGLEQNCETFDNTLELVLLSKSKTFEAVNMERQELMNLVATGESSSLEFKSDISNPQSLATELVAFANGDGGTILIGVADDCSILGLSLEDVRRINHLITNTASQLVRSPIFVTTENVNVGEGRLVIVLKVPKGLDKPYFDKNGVIWLRVGTGKHRINSKEELRRFFQMTRQFHAEELPTRAGLDKVDKFRLREFLRQEYRVDYPDSAQELEKLLKNLNLATNDGNLNLAGVLLFTIDPHDIVPEYSPKAITFPGLHAGVSHYIDTETFKGPLQLQFENALAFILRNLRKVQAAHSVNSPGVCEVPVPAIEELLVNAFIHRDYLINAPIRIFIFDDRIEIISPGTLPNNLTIENTQAGISNVRNPTLASLASKGLLPHRGIGTGIPRALHRWPFIDLINDQDQNQFKAIIHRKTLAELNRKGDVKEGETDYGKLMLARDRDWDEEARAN